MVYTYMECMELYGSDYQLKKAIERGEMHRDPSGVYYDTERITDYQIITKKYPFTIFTLQSALYCYGFTRFKPERYQLITSRGYRKLNSPLVEQFFESSPHFYLGRIWLNYHDDIIPIYSRERLLIDIIRHKNRINEYAYSDAIWHYRTIVPQLDFRKIDFYSALLPKTDFVRRTIDSEIF